MMFRVIQCPKCGRFASTAAKILKCMYCNKSTVIMGSNGIVRVNIKARTEHPREAAIIVQQLNKPPNQP